MSEQLGMCDNAGTTGPHQESTLCLNWRPVAPVLPAMQRALGEGEYNTIGDELRKIEAHLKTFAELCVGMEKSRQEDIGKLPTEDGMSKGFAHLEGEIMLRSIDFEHNLSNALRQMEERLKQGQESLAKRIEFMATQLQQNQQLIMQKLEVLPSRVNVADALEIFARQQFAEFDKLAKFANFLPKRARKRQPKPVRRASKRKSTRKL